jgi:transketolase
MDKLAGLRDAGAIGLKAFMCNSGIDSFGASAAIDALYEYFGLTADKITPQIVARLG